MPLLNRLGAVPLLNRLGAVALLDRLGAVALLDRLGAVPKPKPVQEGALFDCASRRQGVLRCCQHGVCSPCHLEQASCPALLAASS